MFARLIDFYCVVLLLLLQAFDHKPQLPEQSSEGHRVYLPIIIVMGILSYFGFHCLMK